MGLHDRDWYREEVKKKQGLSSQPGKEPRFHGQYEPVQEHRFRGYFSGQQNPKRRGKTPWLWLFAPWVVLLVTAKLFFPHGAMDLKGRMEHLWLAAQQHFGRGPRPGQDVPVVSKSPQIPAASLSRGSGNRFFEYVLPADRQGHYRTRGQINGREVVFLVDTGATTVTVPASLQYQLNLSQGRTQTTTTASDTYLSSATTIDELTVGPFLLRNIEAVLNPRAQSNEILLGMSALKHLELLHRNGTLTLRGPGDGAYQPDPLPRLEPAPRTVGGNEQAYAESPAPAFDNAADNHRRLQKIQRKEEACHYWKQHGLDFDLMTVRENVSRYCR